MTLPGPLYSNHPSGCIAPGSPLKQLLYIGAVTGDATILQFASRTSSPRRQVLHYTGHTSKSIAKILHLIALPGHTPLAATPRYLSQNNFVKHASDSRHLCSPDICPCTPSLTTTPYANKNKKTAIQPTRSLINTEHSHITLTLADGATSTHHTPSSDLPKLHFPPVYTPSFLPVSTIKTPTHG